MTEKYFFGGVTPNGFSTQLSEIISSKEYYTYILKGGPGTGKSQMMKKAAERFAENEDVTCFYCSSDPDSLDAVMMHTSKVIIVDGTPPHVSEPRFPGVCQEIVDLGKYWDKAVLNENRESIIKATELNKSMLAGAANYCKALGLICDDTYTCAKAFADRRSIEEAVRSFCGSLPVNPDRKNGRGEQIIRQISVMTMYGYKTMPDEAESCRKVYILDDRLFAASSMFIDYAAARAMEYGYDVKLSPCLLSGRSFSEHLLIDGINIALMTSGPLGQISYENAEHIDCSVFYDKDRMQPYGKHFEENHSLIDTIADVSRRMFEDAKRVHDKMEQYYISAMDFEALDSLCEKICGEIEFRKSRQI